MPALSNARHERFAQELAKGKSATEAYALAGYKPHDGNASTLRGNQRVIARLAELQERAAEKAEITATDIARQLDEDRAFARENKQGGAAVAASMGKAKVLGLIIEKREDVTPGRNLREIDAKLSRLLESGGQRGVGEPARRAGTNPEGDEAFPTIPGYGTA